MPVLNDVHSALNATHVQRVVKPTTVAEVQALVQDAARLGHALSVAGGRHAMGAQQWATDAVHLDMTGMTRVLHADAQRGLLHIEAGAMWPTIMQATQSMTMPDGGVWAIRQKQTGVDDVTLAGSIAANAHGRGLLMQPLVDDIEDLTLVNAQAVVMRCSRNEQPELFALVVGGYGLFGIVVSATLRLTRRLRVQRLVDVLDLQDAAQAVNRRVDEGCVYGDFQFVIDPKDASFLTRGVFACYKPLDSAAQEANQHSDGHADLTSDAWLQLLKLAHDDKAKAFKLYAQHYLGTHGNTYWADSMQLSTYIPSYADFLAQASAASGPPVAPDAPDAPRETLVIGEHYVPQDAIGPFMVAARDVLLREQVEVIYGTIRAIQRDTTTFLPWAKCDYACVIFNLRTQHTDAGRARTAKAFQGLMQAALDLQGSFFLTYHRYATRAQLLLAYPQLPTFFAHKLRHDPQAVFQSDWYRNVRAVLDGTVTA